LRIKFLIAQTFLYGTKKCSGVTLSRNMDICLSCCYFG